jgi:nucleoside phosphorylase/tetratricopeptide (TPR) repeat protein
LTDLKELKHPQGTVYEQGEFVSPDGSSWNVGIVEIGPGNTAAALETERAVRYFQAQVLFFVGVAGGIKDVRLGDVVAATRIYGYESGKAAATFLPRPDVAESSYLMIQRSRAEARKRGWLQRLANHKCIEEPKVLLGPIAAGEKVVSSSRSSVYSFIRASYSDALAVEMEGRGFLRAAHANPNLSALVVRGISDLLNKKESTDAAGFQTLAAQTASAFALEVLANLYGASQRQTGQYMLVLSATINELDKARVQAIVAHLKTLSDDTELTLVRIEDGSVRVILQGSRAGFEELRLLFESGQLSTVLGIEILDVEWQGTPTAQHPSRESTSEALYARSVPVPHTPPARPKQHAIPLIPQPYLAHPYPLQENFTGRLKERAMLTEWLTAQDTGPMLSLIGMGGLGKSALTWYWLNEDLPQENLNLSGIIWWSFYEQKAGFEAFLSHALAYASRGTIDPRKVPSDYDRMQYLWCLLKESPFLLILDGAERLLRAYHALDAPYKGDDFTKQDHDRHLCCADPRAGTFLQWLAISGTRTRTLLTTRLHPKELEGLAGCRKDDLQKLDPDDAVEFMRRQGINGPRNAIIHECQPYDFLPLCLRLLSGAIREDPQTPNDIVAADGWHPPEKLVRKEHHILEIAYDTMAEDRRELLSRIAAMRGPVDYDTAKVLSTYDDENEFKDALRELVARGLLFRQEGKAHYDLHPIVRQYAYDRLGDKTAAHKTLKDYFDTIPEPDKIETLDDLLPTIELFHHTIRSGGYEDAYRVYKDRLTNALYFQLGAYDTDISLKQAFFPDGEDKPPHLEAESDQAWLMNDLAVAYGTTGQERKAAALVERSNAIDEQRGAKGGVASGLGNMAQSQLLLGDLKQAESNLRREIKLAREVGQVDDDADGHRELGLLLTYMGRYGESKKELQKALDMFGAQDHEQGQCLVWSCRAIRALLIDEPESALEALQKAREAAEKWRLQRGRPEPNQCDLVQILSLSGAAKRALGDLASAEVDLNDALSRCRRIRLVEHEADILLDMARLAWQKAPSTDEDLIDRAKALTREALDIADRCEYRLKQADIHNFLAQMALAAADTPTARKHAKLAHDYAYCDGPPHSYKKALDQAKGMLANLDSD